MMNRVFKRTFFNPLFNLHKSFSAKTQVPPPQIYLETKEDIDIKYEDETFYLNKEFKLIDEEKLRM